MTAPDATTEHTAPSRFAGWHASVTTTPRRAFWFSFVAFFAVAAIWALSNPLMASVDEPAHVVKAAATVRAAEDQSEDGAATGIGIVELSQLYVQLNGYPGCFAFQPNTTAACQPDLEGDVDAPALTTTSAMNYNPLYYVVVGLPSLLPGGEHTVYLMRLITAAISALVLALSVRTVAELGARRWLGLAVLLTITPTFVSLVAAVNPQSIEITGAVLLWVSLLALLRYPDEALTSRRLTRLVIATVLVANARGLGPLWVVIILGLCLLSVPWARTRAVMAHRGAWLAVGLCVAACAAATAWILTADALPEGSGTQGLTLAGMLFYTLGRTSLYIEQLFLAFGWLDVYGPGWTIYLLVAAVGALILAGWAAGKGRDRLVLALAATITILSPVVLQTMQANKIGYFWQGRYVFPVAIGVLILAGAAMARRENVIPAWFSLNLVTTIAYLVGIVQVVAFYVNLHRYSVGFDGGWVLQEPLSWTGVPPVVLTLAYALAWWAVVFTVLRATNAPVDGPVVVTPGHEGSPGHDGGAAPKNGASGGAPTEEDSSIS